MRSLTEVPDFGPSSVRVRWIRVGDPGRARPPFTFSARLHPRETDEDEAVLLHHGRVLGHRSDGVGLWRQR